MSNIKDNKVKVNGRWHTPSREMLHDIQMEQKHTDVARKEALKNYVKALKQASNQIIEVETLVAKMRAKVNIKGISYWNELVLHPSIINRTDKAIEANDACHRLVEEKWSHISKQILSTAFNLKDEELDAIEKELEETK